MGNRKTDMTTDLSSASVPASYRQIYAKCSNNDEHVHKDIYQHLLNLTRLNTSQIKAIWDITGPVDDIVSRTNFYKTLALVAWAQQGKEVSEKLFDTFTGKEYPTPEIADVDSLEKMRNGFSPKQDKNPYRINLSSIVQIDSINVQLVPERKGFILKYSEYIVTSKRLNSRVTRRYNDFVALHELLLNRFPYRLVPNLPPKKMLISDAHFLEERRRGLHRWLTLVCRHPIIHADGLVTFFLTDSSPEIQHRIREIYRRIPDEFTTSDLAATAKDLLPSDQGQIAVVREQIRSLVNTVGRLKNLEESNIECQSSSGRNLSEFADQLRSLSTMNFTNSLETWEHVRRSLAMISREMCFLSKKSMEHTDSEQTAVEDKVSLLLDILVSHKELCERLEKGLTHDHQVALSKLISLKKRKLQGVIRGADSESVEQLEAKMMTQESVISNIELRTNFSLYCIYMETQLVYAYLGTLLSVINTLIDLNVKRHSELLQLWRNLQCHQKLLVNGTNEQ